MITVIGMGNAFRGDDAVGITVAGLVREKHPTKIRVVTGVVDAAALIEAWDGGEHVFIVDCVVSGAAAGTIHRFDGLNDEIPEDLFSIYSTHGLSLTKAIELGRILGRMPQRMTVLGVEGRRFEAGRPLGRELRKAAAEAAGEICSELPPQVT